MGANGLGLPLESKKTPFPLKQLGYMKVPDVKGKWHVMKQITFTLVALIALHHPAKKQTLQLLRFTCIRWCRIFHYIERLSFVHTSWWFLRNSLTQQPCNKVCILWVILASLSFLLPSRYNCKNRPKHVQTQQNICLLMAHKMFKWQRYGREFCSINLRLLSCAMLC